MSSFFDKISSYNIFNYLFPGVLYCYALSRWTNFEIRESNVLELFFVYYFTGLIVSRVGSVFIEEALKHLPYGKKNSNGKRGHFIEMDYGKYLRSEDTRKQLLNEIRNMYRAALAVVICIGVSLIIIEKNIKALCFGFGIRGFLIYFAIVILLAFAFRKQNEYINKRIANRQ